MALEAGTRLGPYEVVAALGDIGQHDGTTYLVMEHLAGETLAQRLRKGALPIAEALEVGAQIAEALDAAHKEGIVHRDLKPSNVMLTANGAKLLDLGLAKLRGSEVSAAVDASTLTVTAPLTHAGEILATRPYMAPEQVEGKATDARTDLWALGCVLYETVAGRPAFTDDSVASVTAAILDRYDECVAAGDRAAAPLTMSSVSSSAIGKPQPGVATLIPVTAVRSASSSPSRSSPSVCATTRASSRWPPGSASVKPATHGIARRAPLRPRRRAGVRTGPDRKHHPVAWPSCRWRRATGASGAQDWSGSGSPPGGEGRSLTKTIAALS